jgi:hypothetical protein
VVSLDRYFREQVSQDTKRRVATCFVAVDVEDQSIAGYYTLAATSIALSTLSPEIVKKLPRYPVVPAVLLGRLAVNGKYQGQGLAGRRSLGECIDPHGTGGARCIRHGS